jgi:hypothetical protein
MIGPTSCRLRYVVQPLVGILVAAAGLLFGIAPAQAAAAALTVSGDLVLPGDASLRVSGTATCAVPSGTATISISANELIVSHTTSPPFRVVTGSGSTVITCRATPVAWTARAIPPRFTAFAPGFLTTVNATLSQAGQSSVTQGSGGYPHF